MENKILYKIDIKKRTSWPLAIFLGLFLFSGIGILGTIIYGIISESQSFDEFYFSAFILLVVLIIVADILLWQLKGVESIIIDNEIRLIKHGKLFEMKRSIKFNEFESIQVANDLESPFWIKIYGLGGGKIIFNYLGRKAKIGQDISIDYAEIVADEIDRIITQYKIG